MSFIDHEKADSVRDGQKTISQEVLVRQSFWGDQQYIHLILKKCCLNSGPVIKVRGVDGFGTHTDAAGTLKLIPH
jgi:hypothetical protein